MSEKLTIAVTGANSGIGLRAVARLAHAGHRVLALCRDLERSRPAIEGATGGAGSVEIIRADLSDPASVRVASELVLDRGGLDVLINNAAVFDQNQRTAAYTKQRHELFWATNHLGPFELTARLSPALARSKNPRVIFVASKGLITMPRINIHFDKLDSESWYSPTRAYYHAKLAQVMTAMTLAERAADRATVHCIRVPAVRLDAARLASQPRLLRMLYAPKNAAAADPDVLAASYERAATGALGSNAVYIDEHDRPVSPPSFAQDAANRSRLWEVSEAATGSPPWAW